MAGDIGALMDHLKIERADVMGYSLGARMTAVLAPASAAAAAFGDLRRHRDRPDRGRRSRRKRRGSAGGGVARRRDRSGGADVSRLRGPDPLRSPGAGGLPARLAATDDARRGRWHRRARADRGRHVRRDRGLGRSARQDHSGRRRCSTFPTATTCGRSATRSTRPACWSFCPGARDAIARLEFPGIPTTLIAAPWPRRFSAGMEKTCGFNVLAMLSKQEPRRVLARGRRTAVLPVVL